MNELYIHGLDIGCSSPVQCCQLPNYLGDSQNFGYKSSTLLNPKIFQRSPEKSNSHFSLFVKI